MKPTGEAMRMENGLVSQHAYTVTGAEQVRLQGLGPKVLLLGTGVRMSEPHASEGPAKLK